VKPVRLIVAFPAGGGSDVVGRIVAQKLGERFGQQVIVDNRPGAGGSIGTEAAVRAAPDGYTVQLGSTSEVSINPALYTRLSYDPNRDLVPVAMVGQTPLALLVHPSMPVKGAKDLIALARARPGEVNYGSAGNGTMTHLAGALFQSAAAVTITHVPYKGAPAALTDLAAGQTQMMFSTLPAALSLMNAGRLKPVAVTTRARAKSLPETPTLIEAGVPGYDVLYWYGLFAPSATPREVVARLHAETAEVLRAPDTVASLARQGADAASLTQEQFAAFVREEAPKWANAVRLSGAKAD